MNNLKELRTRVIEYLAGLKTFEDSVISNAYPEKQRSFPLTKPVITVETAGAKIAPAGLSGYLGGDDNIYGVSALITLRFGIYHSEATSCGGLFESLCDALFDFTSLGILEINCDKSAYDTKTAAYLLSAGAVLKAAWVVPKPEERLFNQIYLKDVKV